MTKEEFIIYQKKKLTLERHRDYQQEFKNKKIKKEKEEVKKVIDDFQKMSELNSNK